MMASRNKDISSSALAGQVHDSSSACSEKKTLARKNIILFQNNCELLLKKKKKQKSFIFFNNICNIVCVSSFCGNEISRMRWGGKRYYLASRFNANILPD